MSFRCPDWPPRWPEIEESILQAIRSGDWGRYKSPHQAELRRRLSQLCNSEHVRLCGSGSAAVQLALTAAGVTVGDEVIVAALDYPGNFRAIESVGAKPVLVDLRPDDACLDAEQVATIAQNEPNGQIRAVIASHLFGRAAPIERLREICDQSGWILIEDACQVPGMTIGGRAVGNIGHLGTISFGGSKPLTSGNGGAIVTSDSRLAARLNSLLDRPSDSQPLSTLQCAALMPQFDRLAQCNAKRQATVAYLESEINPRLPTWQWLSQSDSNWSATHYKVAWVVESAVQRNSIVASARQLGLPMGEGFRSMSVSSDRRCRKPMCLTHADRVGDRAIVLDHSALLLEPEQHSELGENLLELGCGLP
ncbi:MAG: DegT/DnrJ/EryC1/StrS aminotransferase family protein [Pirellulaceae bacterium]|nr:DegT/DnrJ/EryC1/StrS aminotransferase family protein [Pirellulaceae bacterium]